MAYSELVKSFENIREYMREFYVYGFKKRNEYDAKSTRSYDNERRRMESWLGEYMSFHQTVSGKNCFISVDSKRIRHNPLYKALKAKSFTAKDIVLHFYILDMLAEGEALGLREIIDRLYLDYLDEFPEPMSFDASTVRKKLVEYVELGLLRATKEGREILYSLSNDKVELERFYTAICFFAEAGQLGVVGSFLLDKFKEEAEGLNYKHHYICHALESEVLLLVLEALQKHQTVAIQTRTGRGRELTHRVLPIKIYVSTQTGRRYVLGWYFKARKIIFYRLDNIQAVTEPLELPDYETYLSQAELMQKNLWGVSLGGSDSRDKDLDRVELVVHADSTEEYVVRSMEREKRCGTVEQIAEDRYRFTAEVHDAGELLPWLRTFIGRIESFTSSNKLIEQRFWDDINQLAKMYGVGKE